MDGLPRSRFQSAPPRGGRPECGIQFYRVHVVSIRAPAWGATGPSTACQSRLLRFNPRPRVGGDKRECREARQAIIVSIRAPAWGATDAVMLMEIAQVEFQSAPPRGGRPGAISCTCCSSSCFNPRPRVGGDRVHASFLQHATMFQSAPPRGGRLRMSQFFPIFHGFNPRPRVGGDARNSALTGPTAHGFNPRPRVGGDDAAPCVHRGSAGFNPRPRVGGDRLM